MSAAIRAPVLKRRILDTMRGSHPKVWTVDELMSATGCKDAGFLIRCCQQIIDDQRDATRGEQAADSAARSGDGLTVEHRRAIAAALPPDAVMSDDAWADLDEIVAGFRWFRSVRANYPIDRERQRWDRIGKLTPELMVELRLPPQTSLSARALDVLGDINKRAKTLAAFHATWRTKKSGGTRSANFSIGDACGSGPTGLAASWDILGRRRWSAARWFDF